MSSYVFKSLCIIYYIIAVIVISCIIRIWYCLLLLYRERWEGHWMHTQLGVEPWILTQGHYQITRRFLIGMWWTWFYIVKMYSNWVLIVDNFWWVPRLSRWLYIEKDFHEMVRFLFFFAESYLILLGNDGWSSVYKK